MTYDIAIIGSGPAGLTAAIYAARGGQQTVVFTGQARGGQLVMTSEVENFPGFAKPVLGSWLMEEMIKQASRFQAKITHDYISQILVKTDGFDLQSGSGSVKAKSVIIASGASAKWLGVPGEDKLKGKGVSACATCDGFFFKDKIVGVVGGGDSAMEEALVLAKFAKKVFIIHRRDHFRASKIMQDRVLVNPKIEAVWQATVAEVIGRDKVEAVKLKINQAKDQTLKLDGLFVSIGHKPNTDFVKDLISLDTKGYIITRERLALESLSRQPKLDVAKFKFTDSRYPHMTSLDGVFAAGDVADYRYRQAITAAGSGCAAALETMEWLEEKS